MSVTKEKWKEINSLRRFKLKKQYAVSDRGRIMSYKDKKDEGNLVNGSLVEGYLALKLKPFGGKVNLTVLKHKLVAEYFCKKQNPRQKFVIHLDHNKINNKSSNLKWVSWDELVAHWQKSPAVIANKGRVTFGGGDKGHKLSRGKVIQIKKLLKAGKQTLKQIAKKYSVSDMTIHRIKTGENWSHIK